MSESRSYPTSDTYLSDVYDEYAETIYGQLMKYCDQEMEIAEKLLTQIFKTVAENIHNFNSDHGSISCWIFRTTVFTLQENGYVINTNFNFPMDEKTLVIC